MSHFFLHQHSAYGLGRGEQLTHFPLTMPFWIVLICPNVHVSTPWAYGEYSKYLRVPGVSAAALEFFNRNFGGTIASF